MISSKDRQSIAAYKNYILGEAETGVAKWETYYDSDSQYPVDGTGGNPTVTWTSSSSSALDDSNSFIFSKGDIASLRGQGASFAFTIDRAAQGKILTISFDYEASLGTFANGDIHIYIVDVTNGTTIEPSSIDLLYATVPNKFVSTFQTAINSTSYRLCFHQASTTTAVYNIKFDNIVVSEQLISNGAYISDWVAWTPTSTWVSNATHIGRYKRVSDSLFIDVKIITTGTPTSATLNVNLPSGFIIDTTKLCATDSGDYYLGMGSIYDAATGGMVAAIMYNNSTSVRVKYLDASSLRQNVNESAPTAWVNGDFVTFKISIPILGWGSSVAMVGADIDGRLITCEYNSNGTTVLTGGVTNIDWSSKVYDTHSAWNGTTFTAPVQGYYDYRGIVRFNAATLTSIDAYVNGSQNKRSNTYISAEYHNFNGQVYLLASQTLTFRSSVGATLTSSTISHQITITKAASPQGVMAGETVAARYKTAAGQTIANSTDQTINFGVSDYDSHGSVTNPTTAWKFYAQISGKYSVKAIIQYASAVYAVGNIQELYIYKNGSKFCTLAGTAAHTTTSVYITNSGSSSIYLLAGDYIEIKVYNNRTAGSTDLISNANYNHCSIERIGN